MANFYNHTTAEYLNPTKDRRVAIVTGGNGGIGVYTVLNLYLHGYAVYIAGRNETRVLKAIETIKGLAKASIDEYASEDKDGRYLGELHYHHLDLADLAGVAKSADAFAAKESKLHVLINNSGLMGTPYEITKDDYEIQYQVNVVAPFLFTLRLMPLLQIVALEGKAIPRVINVSSTLYKMTKKYNHPSDKLTPNYDFLATWGRYSNSKFAIIQLTLQFAKKYPNVFFCSHHPGLVKGTELDGPWNYIWRLVTKPLIKLSTYLIGVTKEEGALSSTRGALDETLQLKDSGIYFNDGGVTEELNALVQDEETCKITWDWNYDNLQSKGLLLNAQL